MRILINTTLEADGWELEDAVERNRAHPETFYLPSEEARKSLECADRVKLLFLLISYDEEHSNGIITCERMWVTVYQADDSGYVGELESKPQTSDLLKPGDLVHFLPLHICDILKRPDQQAFVEFRNAFLQRRRHMDRLTRN